jgi:SAM-dependent methyltransferase
VLDLERIDEPEASYDVVLCREGLMFALDPAAAVQEIRRVLRPDGRFVIAVWGPRARNPWLGIVLDAAGEQFGAPVPPPGVPGPFSLEDRDRLVAMLADARLTEVVVSELAIPTLAPSFEAWWERTCALAGPLSKLLAALPAEGRSALRARAQTKATHYLTPQRARIPRGHADRLRAARLLTGKGVAKPGDDRRGALAHSSAGASGSGAGGCTISRAPNPGSDPSIKNISTVRSGSTWAWLRKASTLRPVSVSIISV